MNNFENSNFGIVARVKIPTFLSTKLMGFWDSPPPDLGLLHLHDVGLAVCDAVVDVVDVGAQRLQLLVQGGQGAVGVCTLHCHLFSLSGHPLPPSGQLLPLL